MAAIPSHLFNVVVDTLLGNLMKPKVQSLYKKTMSILSELEPTNNKCCFVFKGVYFPQQIELLANLPLTPRPKQSKHIPFAYYDLFSTLTKEYQQQAEVRLQLRIFLEPFLKKNGLPPSLYCLLAPTFEVSSFGQDFEAEKAWKDLNSPEKELIEELLVMKSLFNLGE